MGGPNYQYLIDDPHMIAVCTNCQKADCDGICEDYKDAFRAYVGLPPIKRYLRPTLKPKQKKPKKVKHTYVYNHDLTAYGETHTLREWAEILGIEYNKIYMRMYRGMTFEEAVSTKERKICIGQKYTINGETKTIKEWAKAKGITPKCIYVRMERGYSIEDAIMMPKGGYLLD